ncbi:MAG: phytanoyl-CoA dioxygenase, partial [Lewinella sp.]
MTEKNIPTSIKSLATALLTNAANPAEAERIIKAIHAQFQEITGLTGFDTKLEHLAAVPTAKGAALGLNHAAQCLLDFKRTTRFLTAVVTAIRERRAAYPDEVVEVFYAGCGPYAPFVTLVAPLFERGEVRFSILEINEHSLVFAGKLIEDLGLSGYVRAQYQADATAFTVPEAADYHLLISETLDALLYRECYVPILLNLLPQFRQDVTLIPENVVVKAKLEPPPGSPLQSEDLGTIVDVRQSVVASNGDRSIPTQLPDVTVDFGKYDMTAYQRILLETHVHVSQDIWL